MRAFKIFMVALVTAAGMMSAGASSASASTTIPVVGGNVQMNIFTSGSRTITSVSLQAFGGNWSGDSAVRWSFHGRRTVTGGQSQAIGPQKKVFGTCADASACLIKFSTSGFPFTYACGDWVYGDISIQDGHGNYSRSAGTPVYHFNC
jgi:hypothetical protein